MSWDDEMQAAYKAGEIEGAKKVVEWVIRNKGFPCELNGVKGFIIISDALQSFLKELFKGNPEILEEN